MAKPIISADSHVTEPPGTYVDRIDGKFKDRAPRMVHDPERGDVFVMTEQPYTAGEHDPDDHGRLLRVFERDAGKPVPPDA
jgi:hypothetical protein